MRFAIVDDLQSDQRRLTELIEKDYEGRDETVEISCFASGEDFLGAFRPGRFSAVFLDIVMEGIGGMETARRIRKQDERLPILFTTTEPGFAIDGYEFHALQYLLKPIQPDKLARALMSFAVFVITVPFMLLFLRKTKDRVFQTDAPMLWRTIWLLPASTTGIVFLFTGSLDVENVRQIRFLFARVLLILGMFVVYYILVKSLDMIRRQAALEEKNALQETMLAMQRTQYSQLSRHMEETRRARHDLRQHLTLIHSYLKDGSQEALREYLEQYEQSLPPDVHQTFCRNYAVNILVSYYREEAHQEGIDCSVQIEFAETLIINEAEFCAMLGNLLENALTACRKVKKRAPFIKVRGRQEPGQIVVTVDNSYEEPPVTDGEEFRSTSHEGSGTGTASVRAIAAHYRGRADFRYDDQVFYASVALFPE